MHTRTEELALEASHGRLDIPGDDLAWDLWATAELDEIDGARRWVGTPCSYALGQTSLWPGKRKWTTLEDCASPKELERAYLALRREVAFRLGEIRAAALLEGGRGPVRLEGGGLWRFGPGKEASSSSEGGTSSSGPTPEQDDACLGRKARAWRRFFEENSESGFCFGVTLSERKKPRPPTSPPPGRDTAAAQ